MSAIDHNSSHPGPPPLIEACTALMRANVELYVQHATGPDPQTRLPALQLLIALPAPTRVAQDVAASTRLPSGDKSLDAEAREILLDVHD